MSNIEKIKLIDSRIVQPQPRYSVVSGAVSTSNVQFAASTANTTGASWNITTPTQQSFLDRVLPASVDIYGKITAVLSKDTGTAAIPAAYKNNVILNFGDDVAPCAYPLQSSMSTITATINNASSSVNASDVMNEVQKIIKTKDNHKSKTTPTMLDRYVDYNQTRTLQNSVLKGYNTAFNNDNWSNGAFTGFDWLDENGNVINAAPKWPNTVTVQGSWTVEAYYRLRVTENLMLSPFIFNESQESHVGLYGINNIKVQMTVGDVSRMLRFATTRLSETGYSVSFTNSLYGNEPFKNAVINCTFRTPSLSLPLPTRSIVPYMEYPRYITTTGANIADGSSASLTSQTITLSQIPDLLLIYAKPNLSGNNTLGDHYLPVKKISMNFMNVAGILSSHTKEQLFHISQNNGLDMDWNEYCGEAWTDQIATATTGGIPASNGKVSLCGGFLVLRPGVDFALPAGVASGCGGNFNLQYTVEVENKSGRAVQSPTLYTMAVNSGFFVSENGQSAITTAPLNEQDVIQAPVEGDTMSLKRYVGGSFWDKVNSGLKKITNHEAYKMASKLGKSALRDVGMEGKVAADVLDKLGLGVNTGGGKTTGGRRRKNNLQNLLS